MKYTFLTWLYMKLINAAGKNVKFYWIIQTRQTIIETDERTVILAEKFIDLGFLKRKSYDDCRHIAAAILTGCDFIVSWNFKHIVNVKTIRGIRAVTTYEGYKDLMIYPPSALLEEEEEDNYEYDDKGTSDQ